MPKITPAMQLVLTLSTLHGQLIKKIDRRLNSHGISFTEYLVLHHLHGAKSQTMRRIDLAESVGLSASGVTRLLNPMEKIGLVAKELSPRDARVSLVRLSAAGQVCYRDATVTFEEGAATATQALAPEKLGEFLALTQTINQVTTQ